MPMPHASRLMPLSLFSHPTNSLCRRSFDTIDKGVKLGRRTPLNMLDFKMGIKEVSIWVELVQMLEGKNSSDDVHMSEAPSPACHRLVLTCPGPDVRSSPVALSGMK